MLDNAVSRECADVARRTFAYNQCSTGVKDDANQVAREALEEADRTVTGLSDLLTTLSDIEAPKTVVLISQGFVVQEFEVFAERASVLAAAARATVYSMHLNEAALDPTAGQRVVTMVEDRRVRVRGLEALAKASRGAMFTINGAGTGAFERLEAELGGYYLIGLESNPRDRDGRPHAIRIEVPWNGATVRSRNQILNATLSIEHRTPEQAVAAGLRAGLPLTALPLRVATFGLKGVERDRIQTLIHADVGNDFSAARRVTIGYAIFDSSGGEVDARTIDNRLRPVMNGLPSALQFAAGASLAPGEYTLRVVASDGERAGSVEHRFQARLSGSGNVELSELIAGGPTAVREFLSPTVGYTVGFGSLHGYLEAYGDQAPAVTVRYEIAVSPAADALIETDVAGRLFGDDRMIFTEVIPVRQLPPGRYVLRALVSVAGQPLETLTRPFEIAPPSALVEAPAAESSAEAVVDLFLPVDEHAFVRPFLQEEALQPEVLAPFRERLAADARDAFDTSTAALAAGDLGKAEATLKEAVDPDIDSTSLLAYLAVVYAAAGNDIQAAGAWQSALIDGSDMPQIYVWLAQGLLRGRSLTEAQAVLEEALDKWPSDPRFTGPLASVYAMFGRGREAVLLLEQYLDQNRDDAEAARMGVEWIYQVHAAGHVVHTRDQDLGLARTWAAQYGDGPRRALIEQWLEVLEREP
jgi:hypothetical protein